MRIAVIGAGINGVCSAIALAQNGHEITIFDRSEPFTETSSKSSKLLHGGIRYLEQGHIKLVKEALEDRAWWLENAKKYTTVSRFYIPIYKNGSRSRIKLYAGVKLYQYFAGCYSIGVNKYHDKRTTLSDNPCIKEDGLIGSVSYYDVQMDDVMLSNWLLEKAKSLNVKIVNNTNVKYISLDAKVHTNGDIIKQYDKIVNACGPWSVKLLEDSDIKSEIQLTLVKGSHILVNRTLDNPIVIEVANSKRIIFMLPYNKKTLIGTTEIVHELGSKVVCTEQEIDYMLKAVNYRLNDPIKTNEIVDAFAGLRPIPSQKKLDKNFSEADRSSCIDIIGNIVNIYGGKWTSSVRLGKKVAELV